MDWVYIISIVLGSNVAVELVKLWAAKRARKNALEDRAMAKAEKKDSLEARFEAFCAEQKEENRSLRVRLTGVESTLSKHGEYMTASEYIEITREALSYIKQGSIDPEARELLLERYKRYVDVSGRQDLDRIMNEVEKLKGDR